MLKQLLVGVGFAALVAGGVWVRGETKESSIKTRYREAVIDRLKDPESVRFRDVVLRRREGSQFEYTLCGEVNAKNSMGGYVGFRTFMVTESKGGSLDVNISKADEDDIFVKVYCYGSLKGDIVD